MKINFNNLIKGVLIFSALLVTFSVFYYFVIFLPQKEQTRLEQQEQERLAKEENERKEYIAKRKKDCYDIYLQEKKEWSNVEDFDYSEIRDVCIVTYKSNEPPKSKEECREIVEGIVGIKDKSVVDILTRAYTDCLNNSFSKEF
jgi:hypothetical protein